MPPDRSTKPEDVVKPPVEVIEPVAQEQIKIVEPPVEISNPVKNYSSFAEITQAVNFTPLYIPKKSGYTITSMLTINNLAEIRYSRKWEPNVSLHIRTYKRAPGEELKEISGVNGAKWRINVVDDVTVYISKIEENKHVAAWAVGNYTFSAYVENLSFAAFYSFVSDELVDLSTHYFVGGWLNDSTVHLAGNGQNLVDRKWMAHNFRRRIGGVRRDGWIGRNSCWSR